MFRNSGPEKVSQLPAQSETAAVSESPTSSPGPSVAPVAKVIKATIKTARGDIKLDLFPGAAPKTVANFVKLVQSGFYNGIKFHRVVPDFVIQGGDPLSRNNEPGVGSGNPGYFFEDEINPRAIGVDEEKIARLESYGYAFNYGLKSLPITVGSIAMANAGPNTNGSQFFIVTTKDQPGLDGKHTVFGKVTSGLDVANKIQQGDAIEKIEIGR